MVCVLNVISYGDEPLIRQYLATGRPPARVNEGKNPLLDVQADEQQCVFQLRQCMEAPQNTPNLLGVG